MNTRLVPYEQLDNQQRAHLLNFELQPGQKAFSGDIHGALYTLANAPEGAAKGFALLSNALPVAFLLLKRPPCLPAWADADSATLHALQVDQRVQGQGFGKACLQAVPAVARQTWPDLKGLMLAVDADNQVAFNLYLKLGWVENGEAYKGRIGYERRMVLAF
ncbi:GNAT family N-acetyltransferase [Pseudomonas sp. Fl5BN2]|uniref:GNAT family N-acetyltransferase n=1 Tax=unclassified Pseudomonas TaxID=196821 RepID=UPI0013782EFF|nr:GNAT family N-acetyltransferase [Pseudomonas sp. Fl5BN2]NBF08662.1 GNAT family N-acetyltransferase [Pseudomonas sp. Fl4BN1]